MRISLLFMPAVICLVAQVFQVANADSFIPDSPLLKTRVSFWTDIYGKYTSREGVIHDSKYVHLVFETLDVGGLSPRAKSAKIRNSIEHWRKVLKAVHAKQNNPGSLTFDEHRVFLMFRDIKEPGKFLAATQRKRLRFQLGQKDRFEEGLKQSGRYLEYMEKEFEAQGLPKELTRLPFVESSFNVKARSKVGASGIWQFMRSTGKLYLTINDAVDERNDPMRATQAAAQKLRGNYEALGTWPLAVTAYNHGRQGMMRAVRQVGSTDFETVAMNYKSRLFGFASGNFYACLLAAIEVEKNAEKYFGPIKRDPPLRLVEFQIPHFISWSDLQRFLTLDRAEVQELNPGLTDLVFSGRRRIPKGYVLRLPADRKLDAARASRVLEAAYDAIPSVYKHSTQVRSPASASSAQPRVRRRS